MKIDIKNRYTNEVIFSHECEENTIKLTVEAAVKVRANLDGANLYGANLDGANLTRANLTRANLTRANLTRANLNGANLTRASLTRANLDGANLTCFGDMRLIFTIQLEKWPIGFTKDTMQIGCQRFAISEWREFTDDQILLMAEGALTWWKRWKGPLFAIIDERLKDL